MSADRSPSPGDLLHAFEERLDPARPARDGDVTIVGYGEVSTVFALAALPELVCKRMAGFRTPADAARYVDLVRRYIARLQAIGLQIAETTAVALPAAAGGPVVYLLQPRLPASGLGNTLLHDSDDATLCGCLDRVLEAIAALMRANAGARDGRTVAVDAQLSNWHFSRLTPAVSVPVLIDVGTPFMRAGGVDELDLRLFLAPVPAPLRALYRRLRLVEHYIDDYFHARRVVLDVLGNFYKEGCAARIPAALAYVNRWLAGAGAELHVRPIEAAAVERYYRRDARLLELFLRLRRIDRFIHTRLLRRRYNYILPGRIHR